MLRRSSRPDRDAGDRRRRSSTPAGRSTRTSSRPRCSSSSPPVSRSTDPPRAAFFKALAAVASEFEHSRVLKAVAAAHRSLRAGPCRQPSSRGAAIESDFEAASFLMQFVKTSGVEGAARAPFFRAVASIDSAFERGRVLQALVAAVGRRPTQTVLEILRSAQTDGLSSFERAQVLLAVAGDPPAHARSPRRLHRRGRQAGRLRAGPGAVGAGEERAATVDRGFAVRSSRARRARVVRRSRKQLREPVVAL